MSLTAYNGNFRGGFFAAIALLMTTGILVTMASCLTKKGRKVVTPNKTTFNIPTDKIKKVVLDNGMTILAYKDTSTPKVLVQIAYDVGSAVEQSHEKGLAHLVEHMIFKGTNKLSEGDIDTIARKYGAVFNAYTSYDWTSYFFETDRSNWKPFADILFDCMKNARFDEQHLASELKAVVQELNMYKDKHIQLMFEKALMLAFPPNHPYHFTTIGYKEELARLKASDLKHFYKKYYHPERATLFLTGDIDLDKDVKFASDIFSQLEGTKSSPRAPFPPIISTPETISTTMYHEIQQPWGCMYWTIPGHAQKGFEVSSVLSPILGAGSGSRLYRKLVDELQIADDLTCHSEVLAQNGILAIFFAPKDGKVDECYKVIGQELDRIIEKGVDADELQRSVAGEVMSFFDHLESSQQLVMHWLDSFFVHRDELEMFKYPEKIEALTAGDISKYVKDNLNPFLASKIQMLPIPESAKQLWQEANKKTREQELAILESHQRTVPIEEPKFANELGDPKSVEFNFPRPTDQFELSNGLKVTVKADKKIPTACLRLSFKDTEYFSSAKEGLVVDLMTDLLIEDSKGFTKKENVDCLDALGAAYGFSSHGGSFCVTSANFDQTLEHFLRIMTQPEFSKSALEKQKDITINAINRQKDSTGKIAQRALFADLYEGTDYAWTFDQAIEEIKKTDLKTMSAKHGELISPKTMIMTIVGDIDVDKVRERLEALTSGWTDSKDWTPRTIPDPKLKSELDTQIKMHRDQTVLMMGRGCRLNIHHPDAIPTKILNTIAFASLGSRIYQLRERSGLFYYARGGFGSGMGQGKGVDFISTELNPENADKTAELMKGVLKELVDNGVTQNELDSAKQMYLNGLIQMAGTNTKVASTLSSLEINGLGFDYHKKALDKVQSLTVDDINELAKMHCSMDGMAKIKVGAS